MGWYGGLRNKKGKQDREQDRGDYKTSLSESLFGMKRDQIGKQEGTIVDTPLDSVFTIW